MKKAMVTGCAGFVGRRLTRRLLDNGWHVTGVDNMFAGLPFAQWAFQPLDCPGDRLEVHEWDLRAWVRSYDPHPYDVIFHCAAVVGGRQTIEGEPLKVATDLAIDADFFNWLAQHKAKNQKVVYFSSSAVYPIVRQMRAYRTCLAETMVGFEFGERDFIGLPDQTYGWAKLTGEFLAQHAVKTYGLDVVIYRPFSGYGEDQDLCYPFPAIVKRVVDGENPIKVWGSGDQVRDFIYIEDAIDAVLGTMEELQPGEALNLGSGIPISFRQFAAMVPSGFDCAIVNDSSKPEGVFYRVADITKLKKLWGVPPTSLEEGIKKVAAHLTSVKI